MWWSSFYLPTYITANLVSKMYVPSSLCFHSKLHRGLIDNLLLFLPCTGIEPSAEIQHESYLLKGFTPGPDPLSVHHNRAFNIALSWYRDFSTMDFWPGFFGRDFPAGIFRPWIFGRDFLAGIFWPGIFDHGFLAGIFWPLAKMHPSGLGNWQR